jgi:hypothetical protein
MWQRVRARVALVDVLGGLATDALRARGLAWGDVALAVVSLTCWATVAVTAVILLAGVLRGA